MTVALVDGFNSQHHDHVLKSFRLLIADLCQQFGGGHPGYVGLHIQENEIG